MPRPALSRVLALAGVVALLAVVVAVVRPVAAEEGGSLALVTRGVDGGPATGASGAPALSADGTVVAFVSDATDLVAGQPGPGVYVTVLGPESSTVRLADVGTGAGPCGPLPRPAVSADGSTVAFATDAPVTGDSDSAFDVFTWERDTGTFERVSAPIGGGSADGDSCAPSLSADGSVVAFDSGAGNLAEGQPAETGTVRAFARDTGDDTTSLLSSPDGGEAFGPDLDDAGTRAVFEQRDPDGVFQVVVADLEADTASPLTDGDGDSFDPVLSGDGSAVAFTTAATDLVPDEDNGRLDVVVTDVASGAHTVASVADDEAGSDDDSTEPSLGADGSSVAFSTFAALAPGDGGSRFGDVVLRDLAGGRTRLVSSRPSDGQAGAGASDSPALAADGVTVAFASDADDLVESDTGVADVFVRTLEPLADAGSTPTAEPGGETPGGETPGQGTPGGETPTGGGTPTTNVTPSPGASAPSPTPTGDSSPTARPDPTSPPAAEPSAASIERQGGASRIETAIEVSAAAFPDGADTVVLARADTYPDALAGAPLAALLDAPVLLTPPDRLADEVAAELRRLGAGRAVLLGGAEALTPAVVDGLAPLGVQADRVAGTDRFATAAAIASRLPTTADAYVVEGANDDPRRGWPDALAVAPLAAMQGRPILLVTRDSLPEATAQALTGARSATVVGGDASVSPQVADAVDAVVGDTGRVAGATRFETAALVAAAAESAGASASAVTLASGAEFADALVAGPVVARERGLLLLVPAGSLSQSPEVEAFLTARAGDIDRLRLLGGTAAIGAGVEGQVRALLDAG